MMVIIPGPIEYSIVLSRLENCRHRACVKDHELEIIFDGSHMQMARAKQQHYSKSDYDNNDALSSFFLSALEAK